MAIAGEGVASIQAQPKVVELAELPSLPVAASLNARLMVAFGGITVPETILQNLDKGGV